MFRWLVKNFKYDKNQSIDLSQIEIHTQPGIEIFLILVNNGFINFNLDENQIDDLIDQKQIKILKEYILLKEKDFDFLSLRKIIVDTLDWISPDDKSNFKEELQGFKIFVEDKIKDSRKRKYIFLLKVLFILFLFYIGVQ